MSRLRLLVLLSVLSIVGILVVQAVWVRKAYTLRDRQFRQTAFISLQEVADAVAHLNHFTLNRYAVTQLSADYFIVNTNAPIDPVTLETFIQNSLQAHNLITDYEYGIYNCESDRMVYGAYISTSSSAQNKLQRARILPKFSRYTYYFGIRFPNQAGFIAEQLNGWIWSTVAVLLVVGFFGYTLFEVLKQRRLTEVQRDFINNITHELQTPVSTIRIAADVLQSDAILQQPTRLKQYAQVLGEESRRLQKQVNSVLQLARSERTGFTLEKSTVDLHALMTSVASTFAPMVTLDLAAPAALIIADPYHLETALTNLIDNGLKYCSQTPCIRLQTRVEQHTLIWSVADNGIGIAPEHQKAVFKQFFRVSSGHTHNVNGFGLGLYYVKQVVKAHGWRIHLTSAPGQGSTFSVSVALQGERAKERKQISLLSDSFTLSLSHSFTLSLFHSLTLSLFHSLTPAHILFVEDDVNLGFVIRDTLTNVPFRVTHCTNGPDAWHAFQSGTFDVCVLDVMLPQQDGFSLAQQIRSVNAQIPILFLSALADKNDRLQGLRLGADDYITKPFSIEELILRINVFLRRTTAVSPTPVHPYFSFDRQNLLLTINGHPQTLTHREADVMAYLLDRPNTLVRRDELLRAIWGDDDYFMGRSLDVFISRLRKRLAEVPGLRIENVHGVGFMLRR